jgi:hypothetical protein
MPFFDGFLGHVAQTINDYHIPIDIEHIQISAPASYEWMNVPSNINMIILIITQQNKLEIMSNNKIFQKLAYCQKISFCE